jgi:ClpP class serine protease
VDQIGGLEECILTLSAELKLEDYETDYYPKKKMFESFFGGIFGTTARIKSLDSALKSPALHLQKLKESLSREQVLMLSPYSLQIN